VSLAGDEVSRQVRRRSLRIAVFSLLWVMGLLIICGGVFYWRLNQGPVSLAFMGKTIEQAINTQLPGFHISLGETELELDTDTGTPNVRVRNLVLADSDGVIIASAPKAGVALEASSLLRGVVSIQSLDLIGPRINIRRNLDGSMQLGIANDAADANEEIVLDSDPASSGKSDISGNAAPAPTSLVSGSKILELLDAGGTLRSAGCRRDLCWPQKPILRVGVSLGNLKRRSLIDGRRRTTRQMLQLTV
jgi:hypothetical protein